MAKNLLFVSIAFPPKNDPEAIQTARYFKYLSRLKKFSIDVVTSKNPTLFMPVDESLNKYHAGFRQIISIPIYENKYTNFIVRKVCPGFMQTPDSKFSFIYGKKSVINQLKYKPDIIYSRSLPFSSAILAKRLALHYKVPWVMHLSDPWVDSPLHKYPKKAEKWNNREEKECFSLASLICVTSEITQEFYRNKYPSFKEKFVLFPNVFDDEDIDDNQVDSKIKNSSFKIAYTGGLANTRNALPLLKAVHNLSKSTPEVLDGVKFIFAGPVDRQNAIYFKDYQHKCIEHVGVMSLDKAKMIQKEADLLILFDSKIDNPRKNMFFPSKLLDYIAAKKPILAITGKDSPSSQIVNQFGLGKSFDFEEIDEIEKFLKDLEEHLQNIKIKKNNVIELSASYNSMRLAEIFTTLIKKKKVLCE